MYSVGLPFQNRSSNKFVFPRQSPIIIGYYNDTTVATSPDAWRPNSAAHVPDIHGARLGDLVFTRTETASFEVAATSLVGQGQTHPTGCARTLLNGVCFEEDIKYLGIAPYDYNDDKYSNSGNVFDCQVGGSIQTHYFAPKDAPNIIIGDQIVWDFPDMDLVATGADWGYRKGPTGSPARLTLVTRRFVDFLNNALSWNKLVNPDLIQHNFLRNIVMRSDIVNATRTVAALGRDAIATDEERAAVEHMRQCDNTLNEAARSLVIGTALSAAQPGEDFLLQQADAV